MKKKSKVTVGMVTQIPLEKREDAKSYVEFLKELAVQDAGNADVWCYSVLSYESDREVTHRRSTMCGPFSSATLACIEFIEKAVAESWPKRGLKIDVCWGDTAITYYAKAEEEVIKY